MSRTFRYREPGQAFLLPSSLRDWLPENHLVDFLLDVSTQIDISPITSSYESDRGGQPTFLPRMMLVLLLYSDCVGVFSSRKIMQRCSTDVAFRLIAGEDIPGFRRICEFRQRHLKTMQPLFV